MRAESLANSLILLTDEVIRLGTRLRTLFAGAGASTGLSAMEILVLTAVIEAQFAPTVPQTGRSLGHQRQVKQHSRARSLRTHQAAAARTRRRLGSYFGA